MSYWRKNYEYAQFDIVLIFSENMLWVEPTYFLVPMQCVVNNKLGIFINFSSIILTHIDSIWHMFLFLRCKYARQLYFQDTWISGQITNQIWKSSTKLGHIFDLVYLVIRPVDDTWTYFLVFSVRITYYCLSYIFSINKIYTV